VNTKYHEAENSFNNGTEALHFKRPNATTKRISVVTPDEVIPRENEGIKIHFTPTIASDYKEKIYIETNSQQQPVILNFIDSANIQYITISLYNLGS
jgi:hypothetical protein